MPNTKSAKKRVLQTEKRRKVNASRKSAVKTAVKNVIEAAGANDTANLQELMRVAESKLAQAKKKGLIHKNTAARKISRLAKRVAKAKKASK